VAHDLVFEALVRPQHLPVLARLLERHPELRVVINHAGKPAIRNGIFDGWARDMARLARDTGAVCKLSGLVTEAGPAWTIELLQPYVDHLLETFGAGRLVFGSDWPVVTQAASYQRWVDAAEDLVGACAAGEKLAIFGGNAAAFYRIAP
jgi:L-fuconolactonase